MNKLATFTWSFTVAVPEDFAGDNQKQLDAARRHAFSYITEPDGELTCLVDNT